jgi:hypothetical protein
VRAQQGSGRRKEQATPDWRRRFTGRGGRLLPPALGADRALQRAANISTTLGVAAVMAALWPATAYGTGPTGHRWKTRQIPRVR